MSPVIEWVGAVLDIVFPYPLLLKDLEIGVRGEEDSLHHAALQQSLSGGSFHGRRTTLVDKGEGTETGSSGNLRSIPSTTRKD